MTLDDRWFAICSLDEIPRRGGRRLAMGALRLAVFRTMDDRVFAVEDHCPHKGGRLSEGIVHDNCVTCPLHNLVIDLETGQAQSVEPQSVRCFPVRVTNGTVQLNSDAVQLEKL